MADARARRPWIQPAAWQQAWRALRRRPLFLATAVLTLAFGTGVTTAIFSLVDTVLIKPLPYPDADRLGTVQESSPSARERTSLIAPARLEDWQRLTRAFTAISGSYTENVTETSGREPERLEGRRVAPRFFAVLATPPIAGRTFVESEERFNGRAVAVIGERFWTRRFERDPRAIGRTLTIGARAYEIVGVMPSTFTSATTDVWLPAQFAPGLLRAREARFLSGIGRIRPGVSLEAAAQDLAAVQVALAREYPQSDAGWSVEIRALKDARIGNARRGLLLVFGAVAALWLVAIVNIAGLTLVQVDRRAHELAIRAALGASRSRVLGTVAREGLILALAGGLLGAGVAAALVRAMPSLLSATPRIAELALDGRALAFALITSLLAAGVFGLAPVLTATRVQLTATLAGGARGTTGGRHRLQQTLVVGQLALSVLLVGTATLLLRGYYSLTHADAGFDPSGAIAFHVAARWDEDRTRVGQLQRDLLARLAQLPHVRAAGTTNFLPAANATLRYQVRVDGLRGPNTDGSMTVGARMIGGDYVAAIGARLLAGEPCGELKTDFRAPRSGLVNQRFVDVYGHGQNLVGRTVRQVQGFPSPIAIGGIVADIVEDGPASAPVPYLYICEPAGAWPDPEYVVRTADSRAFASDLRAIVRELDPARAVFGVKPVRDVFDAALDQPRLDAAMLGTFAAAAVTLAAVGLYSLFSLLVSGRAREMAVRLALGAAPTEMIRLVMAGAGRLLIAGIVLGVALTAAADRLLRGALFGVSPLDPTALGAAALTLAVACLAAVAAPALRASRIAPIETLKAD